MAASVKIKTWYLCGPKSIFLLRDLYKVRIYAWTLCNQHHLSDW